MYSYLLLDIVIYCWFYSLCSNYLCKNSGIFSCAIWPICFAPLYGLFMWDVMWLEYLLCDL